MAHDSRAVANEILKVSQKMGIHNMTLMKLIKLVYFAHELMLGFKRKPLCSDPPEAWYYGAVFKKIFFDFSPKTPISPLKNEYGIIQEDFDDDEHEMINTVMECYGRKSERELSEIMHQTDTAWYWTKTECGIYWEISDETIMRFFDKKVSFGL